MVDTCKHLKKKVLVKFWKSLDCFKIPIIVYTTKSKKKILQTFSHSFSGVGRNIFCTTKPCIVFNTMIVGV